MYDIRSLSTGQHLRVAGLVVLCALYPVSGLAQSATYYSTAGGGVKVITPGIGITYYDSLPSGSSRAPVSLPTGAGSVVGNYRIGMGGGDAAVSTRANVPIGNKSAVIDVVSRPVGSSAAAALGRFAGKILYPISVGVALYDLIKELGMTPTLQPDGTGIDLSRINNGNGFEYSTRFFNNNDPLATGYFPSPQAACTHSAQQYQRTVDPDGSYGITGTGVVTGVSPDHSCAVNSQFGPVFAAAPMARRAVQFANTEPVSIEQFEDAIKGKTDWPDNSSYGKAIADAIAAGESVKLNPPTVTGPSTVTGPTTTTSNPDGTTTTATETTNISYAGDNITYNVQNTTNNFNPETNTTTTTTSTTTNPTPEKEQSDLCQQNPDIAACRKDEFDTPEGEIPKETVNITYQAEDLGFGGGTCPADVVLTLHGGQSVKAWDWASSCSKIVSYAKPLILALATFAALMIIFAPGRES